VAVLNDLAVQVLTELPKGDVLVLPPSRSTKPERKDSQALQETRRRGQLPHLAPHGRVVARDEWNGSLCSPGSPRRLQVLTGTIMTRTHVSRL
jgi:hypothetical protein